MAWGLAISNFTLVFLFQTFLLSYVTSTLGVKDTLILNSLLVVAALQLVTVPFFGYMCDVYPEFDAARTRQRHLTDDDHSPDRPRRQISRLY
jgi:Na+/melibiose symporter-like transporter